MATTLECFKQAEFALAAYANLSNGEPNQAQLREAGMATLQATHFASRYTVLTQYNDTGSSLSATVFKDTAGHLTLAIRGTAELAAYPGDLLPTDKDIALNGAGYDQIVALWNWWQRASHAEGTQVSQYRLTTTPGNLAQATYIGNGNWLEALPQIAASGELALALAADPDTRIAITGHSLGGHLAMAFGALFPNRVDAITVFNAPGFLNTSANQTFFSLLGGAVPSGALTTNVIADEAGIGFVPWSGIAGLHNRPGIAIDIPIESQWKSDESAPPAAKNHSQQTLTDALAVLALLVKLDTNFTTTTFKEILAASASGNDINGERMRLTFFLKSRRWRDGTCLQMPDLGNERRAA